MVTHNPEELQLHVEHLRERDGGGRGMERGKEVEVVMESEEELGGREVDRKHDWTFANGHVPFHILKPIYMDKKKTSNCGLESLLCTHPCPPMGNDLYAATQLCL